MSVCTLVRSSLLALALAGPALAQQAELPEPWSQITISGNQAYRSDELVNGLRRDIETIAAWRRGARGDEWRDVLQQRLSDGYRARGYPEVEVSVEENAAGGWTVNVKEGRRYVQGEVRIHGAQRVQSHEIKAALQTDYIPSHSAQPTFVIEDGREIVLWEEIKGVEHKGAVWKSGLPFRAVEIANGVEERISAVYADAGWLNPKIRAELLPPADSGEIDLEIHIEDEGQPALIEEIEISGNEQNLRAEILDYLGLRAGSVWNRSEHERVARLLWNAARFTNFRVSYTVPSSRYGGKSLAIQLTEFPNAPPLTQAWSREEKAVLKARQWYQSYAERNQDIVIRYHEDGRMVVLMILSPNNGTLLAFASSDAPEDAQLIVAVGAEEATLLSLSARERLSLPTMATRFTMRFGTAVDDDVNKTNLTTRLMMYDREPGEHFLGWKMALAPVVSVSRLCREESEYTWNDQVLTVRTDKEFLRIDERTGAILEQRFSRSSKGVYGEAEISLRQNAFAKYVAGLSQKVAEIPNSFNLERPISSFILFALHPAHLDLSRRSPHSREAISEWHLQLLTLVRTLIEDGALEPLDDFVADRAWDTRPAGDDFSIPSEENATTMSQWIAFHIAVVADKIAPLETWQGLLTQSFALATATRDSTFIKLALKEIATNEEYGPLCHQLTSKICEKSPELSAWFAAKGLQKNSLEIFRRDYQALLDDRGLCGQLCLSVADAVRTLDESEVQVLSSVTTPQVDVLLTELRKDKESPIEAALPAALDVMYEAKFREVLKGLLIKLRKEAATRQKEQEDLKKLNEQANQGLRDLLQ